VPILTTIWPAFQSMKFNTAVLFLCLGIGIWMAADEQWQRSRRILGGIVVVTSGLTLAEYAFNIGLGIDQLFLRDTHTSFAAYPGRMAIATATCFLLLGLAVLPLGLKKSRALQRAGVMICLAISLTVVCGYLYGVKSLYPITAFSTMAVHTAVGLMAACLAYFLAHPDEGIMSVAASDSNAGLLLRTLIPAMVVIPIILGWLRLAGQRANLYDTPFGAALLVFSNIACLTVVTSLIARSLRRLEQDREQVGEELKKSEEKFSKAF